MSYTPTEWEPTDVVTATRINALETAVGDMNMSYTPNTWSDGDILSAEKMNALEQAVASGGGSSDFSTAQVTIVNNTAKTVGLDGGIDGLDGGFAFVENNMLKTIVGLSPNTTGTFTALLMNGAETPSGKDAHYYTPENTPITTTGDCVMVEDGVVIYGDCTITIS